MSHACLKVAILGCGFMGTALLKGILASGQGATNPVARYFACVQRSTSADRLRTTFSEDTEQVEIVCGDNRYAVAAADAVILGFQPGDVEVVINTDIANLLCGRLVISMLAGVSCKTIRDVLKKADRDRSNTTTENDYRIVRIMPSIGALVNESVSLIAKPSLNKKDEDFVEWLVGRVGTTENVSEELLNTAVAVSSTSHALTVTAVDALTDGSVSRGLPRSTALKIAAQCLRSASTLLMEKMTLEELKDSISVPRGITTEAWIQLEQGCIRSTISQAVRKAVDYAEGMDKSQE